jgi:hypothetical protein
LFFETSISNRQKPVFKGKIVVCREFGKTIVLSNQCVSAILCHSVSCRPDEHILISFSFSVHEALLDLSAKLKIDISRHALRANTNKRKGVKYELPR